MPLTHLAGLKTFSKHPLVTVPRHKPSVSADSLKGPTRTTFTTFGSCFLSRPHNTRTNHELLRWKPFDPSRNWPDLGHRFKAGEDIARMALRKEKLKKLKAAVNPVSTLTDNNKAKAKIIDEDEDEEDRVENDKRDLDWAAVHKRTFEAYVRGERPNMYGEWIRWD